MENQTILPRGRGGATTRIGPKHQVTIPQQIFQGLQLEIGDYLEVQAKDNHITMIPQKLIPKSQLWFYTPEWQQKEREADKAIAHRKVSGPFYSVDKVLAHLRKQRGKQR